MPTVETALVVKSLLGDLVDVSKMGPDPSSAHVPGQLRAVRRRKVVKRGPMTPEQRQAETERKVAQVSNVVGLAAGTAGTATAVGAYRSSRKPGAEPGRVTGAVARKLKVSPKTAGRLTVLGAGSALGLQAGNVVGDAVTARVLGRSGHKKAAPVEKGLIPWSKLRAGRLKSTKATLGPPPEVAQADNIAAGRNARTKVNDFAGSTTGKATLAGGAAYGVHSAGQRKGYQDAYYGKAESVDVGIEGTFSKFDDDKKRAYGWASVVTMDGEPVIDRQGDYIGLDDIEEAAYTYVRKSRVAGDMHRRVAGEDGSDSPHKAGELIESVVFTPDKCHAMGLPASFAGKWWMGVQVEDDEVWAEVKKGNRTGFSIHGKGLRKDTTLDDIRAGR